MFYSPLRYPGGKNKLAKFIAKMCNINDINGHYIEPYAGGASVALHLLIKGFVKEVTMNDFDRSIYAFWYSILHNTEKFCKKIETTQINIKNWQKFKKIHFQKKTASLFELGFATFFLNRTNYSGIIDGGVIGGFEQNGKYKIDCRFNKFDLIRRIKFISKFKKNIHLYNLDAINLIRLIQKNNKNTNTICYFDPPYYLKGPTLYMNHYNFSDHKKVSVEIKKIKNLKWIVSYDNVNEIKQLYSNYPKIEYFLLHTANQIKREKEILFFSKNFEFSKQKDYVNLAHV